MRRACFIGWIVGVCLPLTTAAEPSKPATKSSRTTTRSDPESLANAIAPDGSPTELLVAAPSQACSAKPCPGQCCNTCGPVKWALASDPNVRVVARGVALPDFVATECAVHYDLRAEGQMDGDRFVVRAVQPTPSKRGRRSGTTAQLELSARDGHCTVMACSTPCCNMCSGVSWAPEPTSDAITWSGPVALPSAAMDCEGFPDRTVTGTWLGLSAFEITSARIRTKTRSRAAR
jgi:hypothetical protein